jgi:hypothetical protein
MTRTKGSTNSMARRVAIASMTVLASSGVGLVAAPMAFGQIVLSSPLLGSSQGTQVTNAGSASANTGGNTAVGNTSTNNVDVTGGGGGLIPVEVGLLNSQTNSSQGNANITTGPATAVGNDSGTTVGQSNASGAQVGSFLAGQQQGTGVTNAGSGSANSGGNSAIGNATQNNTTVNQNASGGLLGVGISLGGPTNSSTGNATINSGAATAAGNSSDTTVGQSSAGAGGGFGGPGGLVRPGVGAVAGLGGAGVGPAPCSAGRFGSFQNVNVRNQGQAEANTGNNVAIGNASQNNTTTDVTGSGQTVSGGLLGVGLTIGGPVNNSTGTAVINTGPATAVGNDSTTVVGQTQGCPQVAHLTAAGRPGVIVPAGHQVVQRTGTLARTGLDTGDLGMIAGALLGAGMLLVASQRRRMAAARSAAVPMAGFGFGLGGDDWDRAVR